MGSEITLFSRQSRILSLAVTCRSLLILGNRPQARPSLRLLTMSAWLAADRPVRGSNQGEDLPGGQLAVVRAVGRVASRPSRLADSSAPVNGRNATAAPGVARPDRTVILVASARSVAARSGGSCPPPLRRLRPRPRHPRRRPLPRGLRRSPCPPPPAQPGRSHPVSRPRGWPPGCRRRASCGS